MKKFLFVLGMMFVIANAGERSVLMQLPLPAKIEITTECDSDCLEALKAQEEAKAFIERQNRKLSIGEVIIPIETTSMTLGGSAFDNGESVRVALLVPKKVIRKYARSVADTIVAYLIKRGGDFEFEVFDSGDESVERLQMTLDRIRDGGYRFVIAPVTKKGAETIAANETEMTVFIPTVNRQDLEFGEDNILFGGIDYKQQIDALLSIASKKVAIFGDGSPIAYRLSNYIHNSSFGEIVYERNIKNIKSNLGAILKNNKKLDDASIFLNMSVIKSALMVSQLRFHDIAPYNILSTQINYNPMLLTLTQAEDREKLYIANSIAKEEPGLLDMNLLLGNNPRFDWIEYSTSIGLDYLLNGEEGRRLFAEAVDENQISYGVTLYKAGISDFKAVSSW